MSDRTALMYGSVPVCLSGLLFLKNISKVNVIRFLGNQVGEEFKSLFSWMLQVMTVFIIDIYVHWLHAVFAISKYFNLDFY